VDTFLFAGNLEEIIVFYNIEYYGIQGTEVCKVATNISKSKNTFLEHNYHLRIVAEDIYMKIW